MPVEISAVRFKATYLELLERIPPEGYVVTKRGKPVARVLPYEEGPARFIGSFAGRIRIHGDLFSTGTAWEPDARP